MLTIKSSALRSILFLVILLILQACSQDIHLNDEVAGSGMQNNVITTGVGLGSVIAVVTSWSRNSSILWAILHGIFGWLYVIYFAVTRDNIR
jgi:hypothetical protein